MRPLWIFFSVLLLTACGGSLSKEQRDEMKEGMKSQEIRRIDEASILAAAFSRGRAASALLHRAPDNTDSVGALYHAKIRWRSPEEENMKAVEKQLIDAYVAAIAEGIAKDDVQDLGDSLLYTVPKMTTLPDSSFRFEGVWSVLMSKKHLILDMP